MENKLELLICETRLRLTSPFSVKHKFGFDDI